jgi:hypothetical protein
LTVLNGKILSLAGIVLTILTYNFDKLIRPESVRLLIIYDTVNHKTETKKMQNLSYNNCHTEGKTYGLTLCGYL